jgi:hypothetical protein
MGRVAYDSQRDEKETTSIKERRRGKDILGRRRLGGICRLAPGETEGAGSPQTVLEDDLAAVVREGLINVSIPEPNALQCSA